jgi:hypothetical protein
VLQFEHELALYIFGGSAVDDTKILSKAISKRPTTEKPSTWLAPLVDKEEFQQSIGSSILEEFVLGHSAIDILRELVQNEFDADGEEMSIEFTDELLRVTGYGEADRHKRLEKAFGHHGDGGNNGPR